MQSAQRCARRVRPAVWILFAGLHLAFQRGLAGCSLNDGPVILSVEGCRATGGLLQDASTLWQSYDTAAEGANSSSIHSIVVSYNDDGRAGGNGSISQGAALTTLSLPIDRRPDSAEAGQAIPVAATALVPVYRIPDMPTNATRLQLSTSILYEMLECRLDRWDDQNVTNLNPSLASSLPDAPFQFKPPVANSAEELVLRRMMLKEGLNLSNPLPSCAPSHESTEAQNGSDIGEIAMQWLPDAMASGESVALLQDVCDPLSQGCLSRSADAEYGDIASDVTLGVPFGIGEAGGDSATARSLNSEGEWPMMGIQWLVVQEEGCGACLWRWFLSSVVVETLLSNRHFTAPPRAITAAAQGGLDEWCGTEVIAGRAPSSSSGFLSLMATLYTNTREANVQVNVTTSDADNCNDALNDGEHFRVAACTTSSGIPDGHRLAPLWLSGTAVVANLPHVEKLRLDLDMLDDMFSGVAARWNDSGIPADNPELEGSEDVLTLVLPRVGLDGLPSKLGSGRCSDSNRQGVICVDTYRDAVDILMRTEYSMALLPISTPLPSSLVTAEMASSEGYYVAPSSASLEACLASGEKAAEGKLVEMTAPGCYPLTTAMAILYREELQTSSAQGPAGRFVEWLLHGSAAMVNVTGRRHLYSHTAWLADNPIADAACQPSNGNASTSMPIIDDDSNAPLSLWVLVGVPVLCVLVLLLLLAVVVYFARSRMFRNREVARVLFADEEKAGSSMTRHLGNAASRFWETMKDPLGSRKSRVTILEDENGQSDRELRLHEDEDRISDGGWGSEDSESDAGVDLTAPIVRVIDLLQRITNRVPVRVKEASELLSILEQSDDVHRVPNMRGALDKYNNGDNQIAEYLLSMTDSAGATVSSPQNHSLNRVMSRRRSTVFSMMISGAADIEAGASGLPAGIKIDGRGAHDVYDTVENIPCTMTEEEQELPAPWLTEGIFTKKLLKILEPIGQDFFCNVLCLQNVTEERPLTTVTFYLLHRYGIIKDLKLNVERLQCYLMAVEDGYVTENPYHNMYHAADVVQRLVCIIRHMGILNTNREGHMRFLTATIAASVHDFNHPGTNNAFVVRNQGIIAKHYNDQHVIENHSIRMALNMIKDPSMNFLAGSRLGSDEDWIQFRHQVTTLVLSTDMSLHFESLSKFQTQMVTKLDKGCARMELLGNDKGIEMAIQMALKTADIGHCAMRLGSHIYWVAKLEVEFFRQGDLERKAGYPISPLMDREKTGTTHPSNQVGFFDVIVIPLYSAFVQAFPEVLPLLDQLDINYSYWKHCAAKSGYAPPNLDDLHWRIMEAFQSSEQCLTESNEQFAYLTDMPIDGTGRLKRHHSAGSSGLSHGRRRSNPEGGKGVRSSVSNSSLNSNGSSRSMTPTPPNEPPAHMPMAEVIHPPPVSPVLKPLAQKRHSQPRALPPIRSSPGSSFTVDESSQVEGGE